MSNKAENDFYLKLKHALQNAGVGFVPTVMLQSIVTELKETDWYIHQGEFLNPIEVEWDGSYPDSPKYNVWVDPDEEDEE